MECFIPIMKFGYGLRKSWIKKLEIFSFFICMRVSELVGFESIEQYLPNRVIQGCGSNR
jgi:hypothetical protein